MQKLDALDATLALWRAEPFDWAGRDCLISTCDHINRVHEGFDAGAPWRGRYRTEAEAMALVHEAGSAEAILDQEIRRLGRWRILLPEPGDILLVRFPDGDFGGVKTRKGAAFRMARGVYEIADRHVRIGSAWSL